MFVNRGVRLAILLTGSSLLVACLGAPPSATKSDSQRSKVAHGTAKVKTVVIDKFKYLPDSLTVNAGETVEWKNTDIVPHTSTAADGRAFDSGSIAKGASWRFTVVKKGTYDYGCTLHPNMTAKLIVQ
ncbi:MAG: cupredoxin family copper-binding protein [Bryobacteraceae bacterium]